MFYVIFFWGIFFCTDAKTVFGVHNLCRIWGKTTVVFQCEFVYVVWYATAFGPVCCFITSEKIKGDWKLWTSRLNGTTATSRHIKQSNTQKKNVLSF